MRDTQRGRDTEGEAGSMQGAWRGTRTWESGITLWDKVMCSTAEPLRSPAFIFFIFFIFIFFETKLLMYFVGYLTISSKSI